MSDVTRTVTITRTPERCYLVQWADRPGSCTHTNLDQVAESLRHGFDDTHRGSLEDAAPELLEALQELATLGEQGMKPDPSEWLTFHAKVAALARAAIAKATEPLPPGHVWAKGQHRIL